MANPAYLLVGGNDEHGMNPPSAGKRTPVMPYLDRPIYENEFNRPAKQFFLAECARIGFRTFDLHPEIADTSVSERVRRANRARVSTSVTFAYNATAEQGFNDTNGTETYYSALNIAPAASLRLATAIARSVAALGVTKSLGAHNLDVAVLSGISAPAALLEAGFMTNFDEAALMLDPEWQQMTADASARAVAAQFDVPLPPKGNYPTLRRGSTGRYVLYLQWLLLVYGGVIGSPDGIFGGLTEAVVRLFQAENGLNVDGIVGPETWALVTTDFATAPSLSLGSRGLYVRYLQQKLTSKLYPLGAIDGIFGSQTLAAVREFQSERGLAVDGIVGMRTWNAATSLGSPRPLLRSFGR